MKETTILEEKSLETVVLDRFGPYIGKTVEEIGSLVGTGPKISSKGHYALLARRIMGVQGKHIEEFEKANIVMKTVRLKKSGRPAEDTSFPYFKFNELLEQKWDGDPDKGEMRAALQEQLEKKFLFVVFAYQPDGSLRLSKVFFWNMPYHDLEVARAGWEDTQRKVAKSDVSSLIKISDDRVIHVRPHGHVRTDTDKLPDGTETTKRCFWLNSAYVASIIRDAK